MNPEQIAKLVEHVQRCLADEPPSVLGAAVRDLLAALGESHALPDEPRRREFRDPRRSGDERAAREQAEALQKVASTLNASLERGPLLHLILEQLARVVEYDSASVMLLKGDALEVVAQRGFRAATQASILHNRILPHIRDVLDRRQPLIIPDTRADPRWQPILGGEYIHCWLGVPLRVKEAAIGILNLDKEQAGHYTDRHAQLASAFANQAAIAIENARLFDEQQRRADKLQAASDVLHRLNAAADVVSAFPILAAGLCALAGCHWISLNRFDELGQGLTILAVYPQAGELAPGQRLRLNDTTSGASLLAGRLYQTPDLDAEAGGLLEQALRRMGLRARLALPLLAGEHVIGSLGLSWDQPAGYDIADIPLLTQIAEAFALALEKSRLFEETRRRDTILEALAYMSKQLLAPGDLREVLPDVLARLGSAADVSRAFIFQGYRAADGALLMSPRYEWLAPGQASLLNDPDDQGLPYEAARRQRWAHQLEARQPIQGVPRDFSPEVRALLERRGVRSTIEVPIVVNDEGWGFMGFDDCEQERQWSAAEVEALKNVAGALGAALARENVEAAEREQRVLAEALRDTAAALNSTLNFDEVLDRILANVGQVVPHDVATIMLIEEGVARIMRSSGFDRLDGAPSREWLAPLRFEVDQVANLRWMMETGQPLVIPNVRDYPGWVDVPEARRLLAYVGAPIRWQGQTVGFLNLDSTVPRFYTTAHAERLKAFADQAAIAIENARLYDAMRQHDEEIAALYRASAQLLNPGGSLASLAEQIVLAVTREFALADCGLLLMDDRGTALVRVVQAGSLEVYGHQNLPLDGPGLTVAAVRTGEMVYAPNVGRDPRYLSSDERTHSELVVPLYAGGLVIGVIDLQSPDEDAFDERARRIASAFAERAGLALENVRLFEAAYRQARQMGILNSMTRAALEVGDFDELVRALVNRLIELFEADNCFLTLWDEALQLTIPTAASGALHVDYAAVQLDPGEDTLTARVLRDRRALVVEDVYHSPLVSEILKVRIPSDKFPTHSLLILPLIAADQKLGAVLIGFNQPRQVSQDEIALGEQAAGQIALAVAQAQLLERLQLARQAAEGANQLKSEFLANTSHELRTPLTGILGSLSLVIDGLCESPEEEREFLQIAYSSSQNLLTILNDVLNFAKIEAGKIEVERQVLDVTGLMEEVVALTRVQADEKQLRLELQLPDPSLPVLADPDKVRQILLNLVGNALKFTERGRVWVEAQADVAAREMRIAVHDTGIGIPADKQSRLFQPFVQADGSMTRKYGGTGLGLSISRQFAERMGGTLTLHSAGAGLGSTFTLRLPLADETMV